MAYELLDGTTAVITISLETNPAGSAEGDEDTVQCIFRTLGFRPSRQMNPPQVTFCSNGWSRPVPGLKMAEISLGGYMSIGGPFSNPLSLIDEDIPVMTTASITKLSADSEYEPCTIVGGVFYNLDDNNIEARGGSARQVTGIFNGQPTVTWVEDLEA